jgi:hypothetical protein
VTAAACVAADEAASGDEAPVVGRTKANNAPPVAATSTAIAASVSRRERFEID